MPSALLLDALRRKQNQEEEKVQKKKNIICSRAQRTVIKCYTRWMTTTDLEKLPAIYEVEPVFGFVFFLLISRSHSDSSHFLFNWICISIFILIYFCFCHIRREMEKESFCESQKELKRNKKYAYHMYIWPTFAHNKID